MRIVINRLPTAGTLTGVGHYTRELWRHLKSSSRDQSVDLFPNEVVWQGMCAGRGILTLLQGLRASSPRIPRWGPFHSMIQAVKRVGKGISRSVRAEAHRYIQNTLSPRNYDLYHEPNFIPLPSDLPTVITVHDLSVLLFPQWHPPERVAAYLKDFREGLSRCQYIFTPSEYVRYQVIHLLNVHPERVRCVYPGTRAIFRPLHDRETETGLRRLDLSRGYFLYVGTIEPRKNLLMLLQVYCSLPKHIRARHPLVLAGPWGWMAETVRSFYESTGRHLGVRHLGYVSERNLALLYNGARCLVFPSHYEGFGFPPIEMMACGGAVLASSIATLTETIGNQASLYSPYDADSWREALQRAAGDQEWMDDLRQGAVKAAARFTWLNSAQQAWNAYAQILKPTDHSSDVSSQKGFQHRVRRAS